MLLCFVYLGCLELKKETELASRSVNPLFILASERSGTNLVRRRLSNCQSDAFGPAPIHALKLLYDVAPFYGDLADDANFAEIAKDLLRLTAEQHAPWELSLSVEEFIASYTKEQGTYRHVTPMVDHLYRLYVTKFGYTSYICKDLELVRYTQEIVAEIHGSRFLYLYRDPRDCILSELKRPHQTSSIVLLARKWRDEQVACIRAMSHPLIGSRIMPLSYETFIAAEQQSLRALCDHAGYRFEGGAVRQGPAETAVIHEWKNLDGATITGNSGKFSFELSRRQINIIESICWAPLRYLGYAPTNDVRPRLSRVMQEADILKGRVRRGMRSLFSGGSFEKAVRASSMKSRQTIRDRLY